MTPIFKMASGISLKAVCMLHFGCDQDRDHARNVAHPHVVNTYGKAPACLILQGNTKQIEKAIAAIERQGFWYESVKPLTPNPPQ